MSMFKKSDDVGRPDVASPPKIGQSLPVRSKNVSVIGPTLVFKGELSADEDLVIEGQIEGTIAHHKKTPDNWQARSRQSRHSCELGHR